MQEDLRLWRCCSTGRNYLRVETHGGTKTCNLLMHTADAAHSPVRGLKMPCSEMHGQQTGVHALQTGTMRQSAALLRRQMYRGWQQDRLWGLCLLLG